MAEFSVKVHIYDLSKGLARSLSLGLLGKQIDGIWHTGIVVYGREYFFGGDGIMNCPPCGTILGQPDTKVDLGTTQIPQDMFMEYLRELSTSTYSLGTYHLLDHNCNSFSNEIAQFLTGNPIPAYITNLPQEVMRTLGDGLIYYEDVFIGEESPFGAMIRPMLDSMQVNPSSGEAPLFPASPAATGASNNVTTPSRPPASSAVSATKPILYDDTKVTEGFGSMADSIRQKISPQDFSVLKEVAEFVTTASCSWSLGPPHLKVIAQLAQSPELSDKQKGVVCGLLRVALLKDDVIAYVTHDRERHLVKLLNKFDVFSRQVQLSLVRAVCNLSSRKEGQVWLLLPDEWQLNDEKTSNSKISIKVCVTSLLHDDLEVMKSGTSFAYNLTFHKVTEDVAVELGSAVIQSLIKTLHPPEPEVCLSTLKACMEASPEVTGLAAVMGLDVMKFSKESTACAAICAQINEKLESFSI